jgi:hypothetical protein
MADIRITLKPPRDGVREIVVDPTSYYAGAGQTVRWELAGEDAAFFTLVFPRGSPFDDREVHSANKLAEKRVTAGPPKRFHYYVAVADDGEVPDIHLIAGCPEIIIR